LLVVAVVAALTPDPSPVRGRGEPPHNDVGARVGLRLTGRGLIALGRDRTLKGLCERDTIRDTPTRGELPLPEMTFQGPSAAMTF